MAQGSTTVALPQLVDLAVNCPEMGTLNLTVLHTVLHVMIQQIGRHEVSVEFKGQDSVKIQNLVKAAKPTPAFSLNEYTIVGGGGDKLRKKRGSKKSLTDLKQEEELKIIERRKNSKEDPDLHPDPMRSPPYGSDESLRAVIVVEQPDLDDEQKVPHFNIAAPKSQVDHLEKKMEKLQGKIEELIELPSNFGLIQASRESKDNKPNPILDMFQILNLTKRMDANETGMQKIASLVEDLAREQTNSEQQGPDKLSSKIVLERAEKLRTSIASGREPLLSSSSQVMENVRGIERRLDDLEKVVTDLNGGVGFERTGPSQSHGEISKSKTKIKTKPSQSSMKKGSRGDLDEFGKATKSALDDVNLSKIPSSEAMAFIQKELQILQSAIDDSDMSQLREDIEQIKSMLANDSDNVPPQVKINQMESKFGECLDQMNSLNDQYNGQISLLQTDLTKLQGELALVLDKMNTILPGGDSTGVNEQSTLDLYQNFMELQEEVNAIASTAAKLIEEKELHNKATEAILEQIDLLKIVKANREDLEDALGDKADACMINRKVSHDQFQSACDDLAKGIDEALRKLTQQEDMWQMALDEIQREIGAKLDKVEVDPLKDFVTSKLKSLHEKFKALAALKKEQEAAGTKSKFLRDVNCISCDKDVIMRKEMDSSLKPQAPALPPSRNMAPYLAYELDQLRKQQKCIPGGKNLNYFESAVKGGKGSKDKDHICNRYCGGSHTTTTPQQRVTRLGHFLEQWGPDVAPPDGDDYIRGLDNHMYKGREEPPKKASRDMSGAKINTKASLVVQGDILAGKLKKLSVDIMAPVKDEVVISEEAQEILTETGGVKPERSKTGSKESVSERILSEVEPIRQSSASVVVREGPPPEASEEEHQGSGTQVVKETSGSVMTKQTSASGVPPKEPSLTKQSSVSSGIIKVSSSKQLANKKLASGDVVKQGSDSKISDTASRASKPRIAFEDPIPEE